MARRSGHSTTKRAVARDAPRPGVRQAYARRSARLVACEAFGEAPRATSVQTYRRARNLVLQSWRLTALGPSARDPRARRTRVGLLRHAGHRVAYERVLFLTNATSPHQGLAGRASGCRLGAQWLAEVRLARWPPLHHTARRLRRLRLHLRRLSRLTYETPSSGSGSECARLSQRGAQHLAAAAKKGGSLLRRVASRRTPVDARRRAAARCAPVPLDDRGGCSS